MNITRRTGLLVLAVCGICCSPPASCTDVYLGRIYYGEGGGGGSGGAGGISLSSGGNGDTCSGTCEALPMEPANPEDFMLLWLGPPGQEPECPAWAPRPWVPVGFPDLVAPAAECTPCTCKPPKGSCALPEELVAYYSHPAECPAPTGTPFKAFAAPDGWDGSCTTHDSIPADPACSGSSCIQHLMVPPLGVTDPPTCEPDLQPPAKVEPAHWPYSARICKGDRMGNCQDYGKFCKQPAPPGFLECFVLQGANIECPLEWTDKHVIYTEDTITDNRGCAPCSCNAPVGSKCSASVSVYTDDCCGCSDPGAPALFTLGVESTSATCGDIKPIGSALGSKKATAPVYQPGRCEPLGGGPAGEATGVLPFDNSAYTACCRPNVVPR
jgi:hypothetical protein